MKTTASRRQKSRLCAYCGEVGPTSRDHVPPKGLFPPPRTADLVTVRACADCHDGTSLDDEYFRSIVLSAENVEINPEGQRAQEELVKSLMNPRKKGFLRYLNESVSEVEVWSPEGSIYLDRKPAIRIDSARIRRVIERVVRGLFFVEVGHPVPSTHRVEAILQPRVKNGFREIVSSIGFKPEKVVGNGAFQYVYQAVPEEPNSTIWILHFYECLPAIGFTVLPQELRTDAHLTNPIVGDEQ